MGGASLTAMTQKTPTYSRTSLRRVHDREPADTSQRAPAPERGGIGLQAGAGDPDRGTIPTRAGDPMIQIPKPLVGVVIVLVAVGMLAAWIWLR